MRDTVIGSSLPAGARGAVRDEQIFHGSSLTAVAAFVVLMLVAAEVFLRSGILWQLPLEHLLQHETDRYTRAAWLVHHPPASGREIIVLGSSTAAAVMELPGGESQQILRAGAEQPALHLVSLTDSGGCYPEHLTLLENAFEHGHRPDAVILFSFPTCLSAYDETDALLAKRMPLVSASLASVETVERSLDLRLQAALVRASAVHRYRHVGNGWLRERWKALLLGQPPWKPVVFEGDRRVTAWSGDWTLDKRRHESLKGWSPEGPAARHLATLLAIAKQNRVPVLIVESPWSPPFFDVLDGETDRYFEAMQAIASRAGATYADPNRSTRLSRELFNDLVHVNHAGARAYVPAIAMELRQLTQGS